MKVDIFDFELDRSLIAKQPASPRDTSRLLDLSEEDKIADRRFYDLPDILRKGDVLVFNEGYPRPPLRRPRRCQSGSDALPAG